MFAVVEVTQVVEILKQKPVFLSGKCSGGGGTRGGGVGAL